MSRLYDPGWPKPSDEGRCQHPESPSAKHDRIMANIPNVQIGQRTRRFKRARDSGVGIDFVEAVIH